ncbi:hypothetical protein BIV57_02555 [Mangrovactinospora gilvigrisea]|uniref:DUF4232 domain-containing protein n=1 Tax=Mangrovactinospora gilvigrisea TaxID=1428644 RepID=A0A1J7BK41_9ACTN|nr:DUF4232 domain-containing protein [Mangrovactinospora gilvigrisea]OIV39006.1 hypothetical protein BIV57_02555 [Mangrovactinospora gilvigrisea]
MRTSRIRIAALATVTAALALSLTACGGADGLNASGSAHIAANGSGNGGGTANGNAGGGSTGGGAQQTDNGNGGSTNGTGGSANGGGTGTGKGTPTAAPTHRSTGSGSGSGSGSQAGSGSGSGGAAAGVRPCQGSSVLVTAQHQLANQQGDHLLVTISNPGSTTCWITSYPDIRLGGDGPVLPHSKKDVDSGDALVYLHPGQKAYSAVNLYDYGSNDKTATEFAVALRGADGTAGPAYSVDSTGSTPSFSWNEADVLNWSPAKPYDF